MQKVVIWFLRGYIKKQVKGAIKKLDSFVDTPKERKEIAEEIGESVKQKAKALAEDALLKIHKKLKRK